MSMKVKDSENLTMRKMKEVNEVNGVKRIEVS